jgi:hypothetical protein
MVADRCTPDGYDAAQFTQRQEMPWFQRLTVDELTVVLHANGVGTPSWAGCGPQSRHMTCFD